ncbi:lipid II flippase MurJ, partial [Mediterraneibacter gnavus]
PAMAITSLGTVMLPRMSNLIANGKKKEAMKYIQKSLIISVLLSSSMAFGLSSVSKEFVPLFYGQGFNK